jgi:hypothetical protein
MSRPRLDAEVAERELTILRDDLHCDAVRISGTDPQRLADTAAIAASLGFEVWVSPHLHDASPTATMDYTLDCATRTAHLTDGSSKVVFVVGCELTWFMGGILPGATFQRRLFNPLAMPRLKWSQKPSRLLNTWLAEAVSELRNVFPGPLTYAAAPIERVDWAPLDYVSLDYYRGTQNRSDYGARLQRHFAFNKPVFITEVGLCTYRGAENAGGRRWNITTVKNGRLEIKGNRQRDEEMQARELVDMLGQVESAGVAGAFAYTFVAPELTHDDDPRLDLDMASYILVKSYRNQSGSTYLDVPWDPKAAFTTVAPHYDELRRPAE